MMKKIMILLVLWIFALSSAGAATKTTQQATLPAYQFHSTSACPSVVGSSVFTSTTVYAPYSAAPSSGGPRRTESWTPGSWNDGDGWGDLGEDDYPTGDIPDPAPVGEPLVLLLMAMIYLGWRHFRRIVRRQPIV